MRGDVLGLTLCLGTAACGGIRPAGPPARAVTSYDVVIAAASSDRQVESVYTLSTEPILDGVWVFTTTHSQGTWEENGGRVAFDSAAPTATDPWPLTLQHAVSGVPTAYRLDAGGAPLALDDVATWKKSARTVMYNLDLPVEAMSAGEALLDPDGLVADLQRNFPGVPPQGEWRRPERIAGLPAMRVEVCTAQRRGAVMHHRCEGHVEGPAEGGARLHEVESWTRLSVDRRGLRSLESAYSGTMVMLSPDGAGVLDRPIAGHRLVSRR